MIVRLRSTGRFLGGLPRSDTLFGALCWGIRWTQGEALLLDLLRACDREDPPFVLSSTFPFADGGGRTVYYLPRPLHWPSSLPGHDLEALNRAKRIRRASYCSQALFSQILEGRPPSVETFEDPQQGCLTVAGEPRPVLDDVDVDRNAINRLTGAVQEGRLFFGRETGVARGGVYLLVRIRDAAARPLIEAGFRFLEDRGIGGDASVGRGQFRCEIDDGDLLPELPKPTRMITLSLLHPSSKDRDHLAANIHSSAYRLVKRKGRVESLYTPSEQPWKSTVVMLSEGSVFPPDGDRTIYGSAPTVKDVPYRVRHNGFGYTVGCRDVA